MRKHITLCLLFLSILFSSTHAQETTDYILIAWNDLGMHCANKDFSKMAILPPYNNLKAQLIKKGSSGSFPQIMTSSNFKITYEIPGNTTSANKTNFWQFIQQLFNVLKADNIGLTDAGLSGNMLPGDSYFHIEGIPITPYPDNDLTNEHPYQLALLKAYDGDKLIAQTRTVIPISNEISCVSSGCHTSEQSILNNHEEGNLGSNTPVLCAKCHEDNALGMPGNSEARPLSYRIHNTHRDRTSDCYKCHPGAKTQCFRDVMFNKGFTCTKCHGTMSFIASSISAGRKPWLQETPRCGSDTCHGSNYAENPNLLFRESKGHGGLYCSACHGSPHAIVPTVNDSDNVQNIAIQGVKGTLGIGSRCYVCHGVTPSSSGPHGITASDVRNTSNEIPGYDELLQNFPNPFNSTTTIPFKLKSAGMVRLDVIDSRGYVSTVLLDEFLPAGNYSLPVSNIGLAPGPYIYRLNTGGETMTRKFSVIK